MLQDRLGISERRACRYAGQHRSTQRHEPPVAGEDQALRLLVLGELAGQSGVLVADLRGIHVGELLAS